MPMGIITAIIIITVRISGSKWILLFARSSFLNLWCSLQGGMSFVKPAAARVEPPRGQLDG